MALRRTNSLLILFLLLASPAVRGQETRTENQPASTAAANQTPSPTAAGHDSSAKRFALDIWSDQKAIWTSPFRMNRRQLLTVALPIGAVTAGLIATDKQTAAWLPNTPGQLSWSDAISAAGPIYLVGGIGGGSLIVGKTRDKPDVLQMGRNSVEAVVDAVIVSSVMKLAAGRERPDQNEGLGRFWKGSDSFPSGHSMDSWAVAAAVAHSRGCPKWLAISSYAVAAAVSVSRYTAHRHFPSDIFVGSAFGIMIGRYVAERPRP
jgi:hypothetical protein